PRALIERHVDFRELVVLRPGVADVAVDADDLPLDGWAKFRDARNQLLDDDPRLQWVDAIEIFLHERVVDDRHGHTRHAVLFGKGASAGDRDPERLVVVGRDHVEAGAGPLARIGRGLARDVERHADAGSLYRRPRRHRNGGHAGHGLDPLEELRIEGVDLIVALQLAV